MGSELLPMLYIFMIGMSVYFFVSTLFARGENVGALSWASASKPVRSRSSMIETSRALAHQFTIKYALKIKNQRYRKNIESIIRTSGLIHELNVDEFIGLQLLWGVFFPIVLFFLNLALNLELPLFIFIAAVPFGFRMPSMHAKAEKNRRIREIQRTMPLYVDLLALSTEAGLTFQAAMQIIVDRSEGKSVLANEFATVLDDIRLGKQEPEAMRALADRLDMPEVTSFANMVIDSGLTGMGVSKVLKEQSAQMRLERFVRAEKAGAQASQLMLMPLIFMIMPAVLIVIFGPVALSFIYGGKK